MSKYHKIISVAFGLAYMIVLQQFSVPQPVFRFMVPAVVVFVGALTWYNYAHLKALGKYNPWILIKPALLVLSGFGLFLLLPSSGLRGLFLVVTTAVIALVEFSLGNFSENLLLNETLLIAFGFFLVFLAFNQYFPGLPGMKLEFVRISGAVKLPLQPLYLAGTFLVTYLLARSFYEFIPHSKRIKNIHSLLIALFVMEGYWALTFLPFHYSVLAILLFNLFYFCLILNYYNLFQILNFKKIKFHLTLVLICSGLVLFFTPWKAIG